jgi:3-oxoisoapionate kinase
VVTARGESGQRALLAFYGDDFTGASENMAQYHRHGLKTFMFLDHPSADEFAAKAREYDVVGIAGIARSLGPEAMRREVGAAFRLFRNAGFRFVQYKLCSTFDSSRMVGNLGVVVDLAREIFPDCFLPVFAAMPEFGRHTIFGQHFARFSSWVFRLDRHPSMSRHPTTPMTEADLGRILEDQGAPACGLVDTLTYAGGVVAITKTIARERARVPGPIVFDGLHDYDCRLAAEAIWGIANGPESVVVLSSQGFAHGFGLFRMNRPAGRTPPIEALAAVEKLLVVSGSAAPLTARQIDVFARSGAATARLVASRTLDPARTSEAIAAAVDTASRALGAGRSVCVYTALGPEDEDTAALREVAARRTLDPGKIARCIGEALGEVVMRLVERHGLTRVVIAGGDTSSYALRRMAPQGLAVISGDYATSAHVMRLSGTPPVDGLETTLKGGQVGEEGFFVTLRDGRAASPG